LAKARIPPEYVNVPTALAYRKDLSAPVRETGMQIIGLGWNHNYEYTDPVTLTELCGICGVSRARLYGHLQQLVVKGVLRYTYTAVGFVFDLRRSRGAMQLSVSDPTGSCTDSGLKNETGGTLHDFVFDSDNEEESKTKKVLEGGVGGTTPEPSALDEARLVVLERMGVLEPTRSEIAGLAWATVEYLEAWEEWLCSPSHGRTWLPERGIGLVVQQMRRGQSAPVGKDRGGGRERYREWARSSG